MKKIFNSFWVIFIMLIFTSSVFAEMLEAKVEEQRSLGLEDCLNIALEKNPLILSAKKNSEAYKTRISQARAAYFPKVEFKMGVEETNAITTKYMRFIDRDIKSYNLGEVRLTQQLYDFGKTRMSANVQKASYNYTLAEADDTIDKVVYQVKEAYYYLLYTVHQLNVAKDMVEQYELHYWYKAKIGCNYCAIKS